VEVQWNQAAYMDNFLPMYASDLVDYSTGRSREPCRQNEDPEPSIKGSMASSPPLSMPGCGTRGRRFQARCQSYTLEIRGKRRGERDALDVTHGNTDSMA